MFESEQLEIKKEGKRYLSMEPTSQAERGKNNAAMMSSPLEIINRNEVKIFKSILAGVPDATLRQLHKIV